MLAVLALAAFIIALILHKAFVDLYEEGTEAAAATAVVMGPGSASAPPPPKVFRMSDGSTHLAPGPNSARQALVGAEFTSVVPGSPIAPIGNPMLAEVGPGAYAQRDDVPDTTAEGLLRIVPLRAAPGFGVDAADVDQVAGVADQHADLGVQRERADVEVRRSDEHDVVVHAHVLRVQEAPGAPQDAHARR